MCLMVGGQPTGFEDGSQVCKERSCEPFRATSCGSGLVLEVHMQAQAAHAAGAKGHGGGGWRGQPQLTKWWEGVASS